MNDTKWKTWCLERIMLAAEWKTGNNQRGDDNTYYLGSRQKMKIRSTVEIQWKRSKNNYNHRNCSLHLGTEVTNGNY